MEEKLHRVVHLIRVMNLRSQEEQALHNALGHIAVAARRLGLSDLDEWDLIILILEFIDEARRFV
jgi:hypothetical protein